MSIKQAIEALESCDPGDYSTGHVIHPSYDEEKVNAALAALRSMPAEPLFYYRPCMDGLYEGPHHARSVLGKMLREERPNDWHPLYAAHVPETNFGNTPHTEAVRMSDQEIDELWKAPMSADWEHREFARAVEQATAARLGVKL